MNNYTAMVKIEFFKEKQSLGTYECIETSNQDDRNRIAEQNGISDYDYFILDAGRVEGMVKDGVLLKFRREGEKKFINFNDPNPVGTEMSVSRVYLNEIIHEFQQWDRKWTGRQFGESVETLIDRLESKYNVTKKQ